MGKKNYIHSVEIFSTACLMFHVLCAKKKKNMGGKK